MDGLSFTNSEQTLITQSHLLNTEHTHARPPTITFCHCRKYNMKSNQKWLEGKEANDWHFRESGTLRDSVCRPKPLVQSSMTEYEQNVSLTRNWLTAISHRAGFTSSSDGGIKMDWCPEYTLHPVGRDRRKHNVTTTQRLPTLTNKTHWENNTSVKRDRSWAHTLR